MNKLQFYSLMFMPYPFIPPAEDLPSTWVNLPNTLYDPKVGHRLYNEYLELNVLTEKLGYDGVLVNEHHQTAYGTMPSPNIMASYIVAKTERIKVGVIGNALPLHGNPMRVAEEIAMLDVISGGRMISGFVRGTGNEYFSYGIDPSTSRERFWEAHDLILKAWTEPGPFAWDGKYFHLPYVNPWPQPLQKPHPPIWLPGLRLARDDRRGGEAPLHVHAGLLAALGAEAGARHVPPPGRGEVRLRGKREQLGAAILIYVAETDEQAHREARPHITWLFREGLKHPNYFAGPPGYQSQASFRNFLGTIIEKGHPGHLRPAVRVSDRQRLRDRRLAGHGDRGADEADRRSRHGRRDRRRRPVGRDAALDGDQEHDADGRRGDAALPRARRQADVGEGRAARQAHAHRALGARSASPPIEPSIPWGENGDRIDPRIAHLPELVDEAMARQEAGVD